MAAVYDGSQKQLFIDGLLDAAAATNFGPGAGTTNLRIGVAGNANNCFFNGLIDEVRVTAGVRYVSSFIPELAQSADGSDTRGLWNFDTQTPNDSSGKGNHGTAVGGGAYYSSACPVKEKYADWVTAQAQAADQPVKIDFDSLANGTILTTQYPQAVFSSGSGQLPVVYNPRSNPNKGATAVSLPNVLTRFDNVWPFPFDHFAPLTVQFTKPINSLRFAVVAVDALAGNGIFDLDVYQNNVLKQTRTVNSFGSGVNFTVAVGQPASQSGINEVTKIIIYNIRDPFGLEFDDLMFNVPEALKVNMTNPKVSGNIQGTVQKALLGADVRLQAMPNRTGGTYAWSVAGPHQRVSTSADQTAILERWTEPGTYRVTVSYSLSGETTSSSVDVNVIAPTLSSFTANQSSDRIVGEDDSTCFGAGPSFGTVRCILGCPTPPENNPLNVDGITFSATAQIPPAQYLSDPAQSGIKVVQIISDFDKALVFGSIVCNTARNSESDVESGWQIDTTDPYSQSTVHRFSESTTLTTQAEDTPSSVLRTRDTTNFDYEVMDALSVDARFETYIVYFTGSDPGNPIFQRAIGFSNPNNDPHLQMAYLPWSWAGRVFLTRRRNPSPVAHNITRVTVCYLVRRAVHASPCLRHVRPRPVSPRMRELLLRFTTGGVLTVHLQPLA